MSEQPEQFHNGLVEIRAAREQAEFLRDQLAAEYQRLCEEQASLPPARRDAPQRLQGCERIRKAIEAADCAIASIDQALREIQHDSHDSL